MKIINIAVGAVCVLFTMAITGCGSGPEAVNREASTSAIHAAQEVGASEVPSASLYLQLAKEGCRSSNDFGQKVV